MERAVSSITAAISLIDEVSDSLSSTNSLIAVESWVAEDETASEEVAISSVNTFTLCTDAAVSSIAAAFSFTEEARFGHVLGHALN